MKKMKVMMVAALMLTAFAGFAACSYSNSGSMSGNLTYTSGDLQPKPFKAIDIDVAADVYYTQNDGDKHEVRLDFSGIKDEKLVQQLKDKLKVVYRDGGVEIGLTGRVRDAEGFNVGKCLKIYITSPDLVKISREGVGRVSADKINSDRLDIDNEGVGSVVIKQLLANKVSVDNEGVGSVELGNVTGDNMKIDNEGVGSVNVKKLTMGNLTVDNEGVGSVTLDFFKGGSLKVVNEGVGKVSAHVDCKSVNASLEGVGSIKLSGSTLYYTRDRDGVGKISDRDLKVKNNVKR